jgi:hypothetical protein
MVMLGAVLVIGPYLYFNYTLSGELWPTTFFAKQAEYAVLRDLPYAYRFGAQLVSILIGVTALLALGLILQIITDLRQRKWGRMAPIVWIVLFIGVYAFRLPVTYQHARYAIPTIPVFMILGLEGMRSWVMPSTASRNRRLISRAWLLALPILSVAFWLLGARAYAHDVAIIETEMVAASHWISTNTEEEALIAAHDIGALGYFGERMLVDMAGLISPEVIPIMRDEVALAEFLDSRGADYLMTFPGWYPLLVEHAELIYTTGGTHSLEAGGENMGVYRWLENGFAP